MNQIVQGTNDSSILSKNSMVSAGYFKDDYIKYFINKPVKRAPLINIGYFVRACVIDASLTYFLKSVEDVQVQIISLGAGFDTTYFRLAANFPNIMFYEIDLPGVVKKKVDIIKNCKHLRSKIIELKEKNSLENQCELVSKKYTLLSHDLSNLVGLENKLKTSGFEFNKTTLLFSECAITYLEEVRSTEIIRWAQRLPKSVFITFEQINPDDAFGQVMISHFIKIQSPLKSVNNYKNIYQQIQRYLSCGWDWCRGMSAMDILLNLCPEKQLYEQLKREPFDEFEEWHLKCCHYSLVVATKTEFIDTWNKFMTSFDRPSPNGEYIAYQILKWEELLNIPIQRFGHSLLTINEDSFLLIGGFGCYEKKHTRLSNILYVSLTEPIVECIIAEKSDGEQPTWDCMYATCVKIDYNEFVIYGGRTSPLKPVNYKPWICQIQSTDSKFRKISAVQYCDSNDTVNKSEEPPPRWRHTAVLIAPTKILIYGGITTGLKVLNDLWMLSICSINVDEPKKLSWSLLYSSEGNNNKDKIPAPTFSHSAVVHNDTMFISGGLDNSAIALNHLWAYSLNVGWQKLDTTPQLKPRYGHSSHITSNKQLILIGGVNLNYNDQPKLTVIYLNSLTSTEYDILPNNPESPSLMIHNHVSVYHKENNSIYVAGGGGNCFSFGTYLNSNLAKISLSFPE